MSDEQQLGDLAVAVTELAGRLKALDDWCQAQLVIRENKIAGLERTLAHASSELARLRSILASVGVVASQAEPLPEPEPDEDFGT